MMTVLKQDFDNETILFMQTDFNYSNNTLRIPAVAHQLKSLIPSSQAGP